MKKIFCAILCFIFLFNLGACGKNERKYIESTSLNDSVSGGFVDIQGTVYGGKCVDDGYYLCAVSDKALKKLAKTKDITLHMVMYDSDSLLYFDDENLCMINLESNETKNICSADNLAEQLIVRNKHAYFTESGNLIGANVETGERSQLSNVIIVSFDIKQDTVYYCSLDSDFRHYIKKMDLNNLENVEMITNSIEGATHISVQDDGLYFLNNNMTGTGDQKIYKINSKNELIKISDDKAYTYNMDDEWIYYACRNEYDKVYRMKKDGSEKQQILDKECYNLLVFENVMYCFTKYDFKCYKINLDTLKYEDCTKMLGDM